MDEREMLDDLDLWFEAACSPYTELTEEEISAVERRAGRWLMDIWGL